MGLEEVPDVEVVVVVVRPFSHPASVVWTLVLPFARSTWMVCRSPRRSLSVPTFLLQQALCCTATFPNW